MIPFYAHQVIVERAEKSDVPEIDKKKSVSFAYAIEWMAYIFLPDSLLLGRLVH